MLACAPGNPEGRTETAPRLVYRRRAGRFRGLRPAPGGMRRAVLDQPPVDETAVRLPPHPLARVERDQRALELGQTVEGNARKVVVLEVVVRVQEDEVPEPVAAHQRAPLRRIRRIDVVV